MPTVPVRRPLRVQLPCPGCGAHRRAGYLRRGHWKGHPNLELCWRCFRSVGDALRADRLAEQHRPRQVREALPQAA